MRDKLTPLSAEYAVLDKPAIWPGDLPALAELLTTVDTAAIFLDREQRVEQFTPAAREIYDLRPSHLGQPLSQVAHRAVEMPPLPGWKQVRAGRQLPEQEIVTDQGGWYLRRIMPRHASGGQPCGMVVVFIDIRAQKTGEFRLATEHAVACILAESRSMDEASTRMLDTLRVSLGAAVADLWLGELAGDALVCKAVSVDSAQPELAEVVRQHWLTRLGAEQGLPGQVWQTQQPVWQVDAAPFQPESRLAPAIRAGLRYAVAFPIVSHHRCYGVLGFYAHREWSRQGTWPAQMAAIGCEVGQFIRRTEYDRALREEESRKAAILQSALDCIITMDENGRIIDFNPAAERTFGYRHKEVVGRPVSEVLIPERMRESHSTALETYLQTGAGTLLDRRVELLALRRDGTEFPVELAMTVTRLKGQTPFFTAYLRDITERKRAEQALRESETRYRQLLQATRDAIFVYPLDRQNGAGTFIEVNDEACRRLGYTREELLQMSVRDISRSSQAELREAYRRFRRRGEITRLTKHVTKDGQQIPVEVSSRLVTLDGRPHVVSSSRDLRERHESENALRASEERLRFTLEAARVGSWDWNIRTGYVNRSDSLLALYGRSRKSRDYSLQEVLADIYPADRERVQAAISAAVQGDGNYEIEYRYRRPDKTLGWLHAQGRVRFSAQGEPLRMAGICMDVTERKRAEETTRLLAEAGTVLTGSLDYESTLQAVAGLLVPSMGDWCVIDLVDSQGQLRHVAVQHVDPHKVHQAREALRRDPPQSNARYGSGYVARTGRPQLYPEIDDELLQALAADAEQLQQLRQLGLSSGMVVPLMARNRTIGTLTLGSAESNRRYSERDLEIISELAIRCALAVDNARLYAEARKELAERKQVERELRQQTQALGTIHRISVALAAELDQDRLLQAVTDAGFELTHADFGAFVVPDPDQATCRVLSTTGQPPADLPALLQTQGLWRDLLAECRSLRLGEVAGGEGLAGAEGPGDFAPDRPIRSMLLVPVVSRTGQLHGGLVFGQQQRQAFSEQHEQIIAGVAAHAAIAMDNARLYQAAQREIRERIQAEAELRKAREAAEAASRSKTEFLANMSHEIRTPMTAILGYADLLAGHLKDPDNQQCVATIKRNGDFLLEIINDILDLSKIEAGKIVMERQRFAPLPLLAEICSLMDVRAQAKGIPLQIEFAGSLPETIESDPKRLRQILINLLGNAIKFTDQGRVRLVVQMTESPLPSLQFEIIDTGIGIQPEQLEKLFQPFTQADNSVTRQYGGTGLGLTISRRLARMLGGEIQVQSEPGKGSRFTLTIATGILESVPCIQPETMYAAQKIHDPQQGPLPQPPLDCRVLIADDRREVRFLAQHFVEEAGGTVLTAANGREALEKVAHAETNGFPVDVIVMDVQMPVMDGLQACAQLRANGYRKPVIALTAHAMQGDRQTCLDAGCDDYITKPIDRFQLIQTIARNYQASKAAMPASPEPTPTQLTAQKVATGEPSATEGNEMRILLVEDNADAREIQQVLLQMRGHLVATAASGAEALQLAGQQTFDVVLLDIGLPDQSGYEVVRQLKQMAHLQGTIFIAVSGRSEPKDRQDARQAGFDHHVIKPVVMEDLEQLFQRCQEKAPGETRKVGKEG